MRRWLVLALLLLTALALAGGADALTRAQANAIALKTLKPQALKGPTILFGLPKALPAGKVVSEGGSVPPPAKPVNKPVRLGKAAWLFWLDQVAYAQFQHPSRWLLVDDATGKVVETRSLSFYPLVDGKRPAYLASWKAYGAPANHVFTSLPKTAKARGTATATAPATVRAVPAGAFKDDCLISIGLRDDPLFSGDFGDGVVGWAQSVGLRAFKPPNGPGGRPAGAAELRSGVRDIVENKNCKDVLIFASGHGYPGPRFVPAIQTGADAEGRPWTGITAGDLSTILRDHPKITFKVKLNGCFSGRFVDPLKNEKNLLVIETAANSTEYSWGRLPAGEFQHPDDGHTVTVPAHENPGRSEFVNGNIAGLQAFFASAAEVAQAQDLGGSLLARALSRAPDLGSDADGARRAGLTHPQLHTNMPGFVLKGLIGYRHLGSTSEVCGIVGTEPARPNATVTFAITGPGVADTPAKTSRTNSSGGGAFSFGINSYGTYTVTVTITADGVTKTKTLTVAVTAADGNCPV